MTPDAARLVDIALQWGRMSASALDVASDLRRLCAALPVTLGVDGAVIMLVEPLEAVYSSDPQAEWMGEVQRRAGRGPLPDAISFGRSMMTPDLTRIGPPEIAAASAECGLTSSTVLPIEFGDVRLGALQLLGAADRPVATEHAAAVRVVMETLAARLMDVHVMRRLSAALSAMPPPSPVPPRAGPRSVDQLHPAADPLQRIGVEPDDTSTNAIAAVSPHVPSPRPPISAPRHARLSDEHAPLQNGDAPRGGRRRALNEDQHDSDPEPPDTTRGDVGAHLSSVADRRTGVDGGGTVVDEPPVVAALFQPHHPE